MKVTNLTGGYLELIIKKNDIKSYENTHPYLFKHYLSYWADDDRPYQILSEKEVADIMRRIRTELVVIERAFASKGFDFAETEIILFVGKGTSNGHALEIDGRFVVWIPVETYTSNLLARVFITHEIIHALHYSANPNFYFTDKKHSRLTWRELITEGLATYGTMVILATDEQTSLWADYLSDEKAESCLLEYKKHRPAVYKMLLDHFNQSDPRVKLFLASDPDDIFKFRAGYYAGLEIIKHISESRKLDLHGLLKLPRIKFQQFVLETLRHLVEDFTNPE
jgi:hypothetical protein